MNEQTGLALQDALCNALKFTPQDLLWNRQGTLSPTQREALQREVRSGIRWSLVLLFVSIAGTVALLLFAPDLPVIVGALLGGGLCVSYLLVSGPKKRVEIEQALVSWKEGYVLAHKIDDDASPTYSYRLDDLSFNVSHAAYQALADHTRYRLYYLPHAGTLLSIEPLEASQYS